jgi:hypothetical protein
VYFNHQFQEKSVHKFVLGFHTCYFDPGRQPGFISAPGLKVISSKDEQDFLFCIAIQQYQNSWSDWVAPENKRRVALIKSFLAKHIDKMT